MAWMSWLVGNYSSFVGTICLPRLFWLLTYLWHTLGRTISALFIAMMVQCLFHEFESTVSSPRNLFAALDSCTDRKFLEFSHMSHISLRARNCLWSMVLRHWGNHLEGHHESAAAGWECRVITCNYWTSAGLFPWRQHLIIRGRSRFADSPTFWLSTGQGIESSPNSRFGTSRTQRRARRAFRDRIWLWATNL